jgi:hypothetical protein
MVATYNLLLFVKVIGITGLAILAASLFLFVSWPTSVNAGELNFGKSVGSVTGPVNGNQPVGACTIV